MEKILFVSFFFVVTISGTMTAVLLSPPSRLTVPGVPVIGRVRVRKEHNEHREGCGARNVFLDTYRRRPRIRPQRPNDRARGHEPFIQRLTVKEN